MNPLESRSRWMSYALLIFACTLVLINVVLAFYRTQLPTEGWGTQDQGDFDHPVTVFTTNLFGEPGPIQPGDRFLALNGVPLPMSYADGIMPPPITEQFRSGTTVTYTVLRNGQIIDLTVPLKSWTTASVVAYRFPNIGSVLAMLGGVALFGLSMFVLLRRPHELAARALLLFATANQCSDFYLTPDGPTTTYSRIALLTILFGYVIWAVLLAPSLFMLTLTFPQPKQIIQRFPWLLLIPFMLYWLFVAVFGPGVLALAGFGLSAVYFILALAATIHSVFRRQDRLQRTQLLWAFGGILALLISALPLFIGVLLSIGGLIPSQVEWLDTLTNITMPIGGAAFQVMIAIAILRYRLFDIEIIIRRTLAYTVLTLSLVTIYLLGVVALQALFVRLTGQESTLAVVASTLAIAALFQPLRRRVQAIIDKRFFRKKYDAQQVLEQFAQRAQQESDIDTISADIVQTVQETLEPEGVRLWLIK
ncbi:hypothetical protein K2Z83_01105 [Oscillochloris sp. ZM17-4]|uniref:hypothetical protein n=1 Tax=Oscillochloris sp. ZM17-4 TaxID=2866714 RepID=UPI001C72D858|nr:hypothetical protein [Oscillochloris sp. ZM17-4]MBX0326292.1 hypothetical protein [Oscillochloris sp. ZM17-4]